MSQQSYDDEEWNDFVKERPTILIAVTAEIDKQVFLKTFFWAEESSIYFSFSSKATEEEYKQLNYTWNNSNLSRQYETLYILAHHTQLDLLIRAFNLREFKFSAYNISHAYLKLSEKQIKLFLKDNDFDSEFLKTVVALNGENDPNTLSYREKPVKFLGKIIETTIK